MKHSPMFNHSIESFEHGLEHFLDGTERSRKFALLHIDHAIELMLKEKCVQIGKSIYKGDGTTLGVHEVFSSLDKASVSIPERPRLEELHDLRNTVQHKGLVPDALTTQFHVEIAYHFIKRFLEGELTTPLDSVLAKRYRHLMEGIETSEVTQEDKHQEGVSTELYNFDAALKDALDAENPSSVIIAGYSILQQAVRILANEQPAEKIKFRTTLRNAALARGITQKQIDDQFKPIFILRGQVLKGDYEATPKDAQAYLDAVADILRMTGLLHKSGKD